MGKLVTKTDNVSIALLVAKFVLTLLIAKSASNIPFTIRQMASATASCLQSFILMKDITNWSSTCIICNGTIPQLSLS